MKKLSIILAMLALVLVFGLTLVSCGEPTPKTLEGLFDELKGFSAGGLWARHSNGTFIGWCYEDQRWEGLDADGRRQHDLPAPFGLADARELQGAGFWQQEDAYAGIARDLIKKLDSFYRGLNKQAGTYTPYSTTIPAGTTYVVWYTFYMLRDGTAGYGSSPVESQAPLTANYYTY